jgi:methionyl-tRNA formyltransferase
MKVVFMGTPDFAVPTLTALLDAGHSVLAVITSVDKVAGRGQTLQTSAVKQEALAKNIPVWQPANLKDETFLQKLTDLQADIFVVVAFRMLPEKVWSIPSKGTLNLHASSLPDYRGAAPINWVLMNGESKTGATTFLITHEIDTGDLLLQYEINIPSEWNAGDLYDHLKMEGANLVVRTLLELQEGTLSSIPQDHTKALHAAPKIFRETCKLDFNTLSVLQIHQYVRGLSPYPGAWCKDAKGMTLKIFKTHPEINFVHSHVPGTLVPENQRLWLYGIGGRLELLEVQPEGKKRMKADDYQRGYVPQLTVLS